MNKATQPARSLLMLAAENGALPGGKVGGMGDVVRDTPVALAGRGWDVSVLTPAYGVFGDLPASNRLGTVDVNFGGSTHPITIYEVASHPSTVGVRHFVLDSTLLTAGKAGQIYINDKSDSPFATDASRFAQFCIGAAEALITGVLETPGIIHLHDWHTALFLALCKYDKRYARLADIRNVYTIHNLAIQGTRPFEGDDSSFFSWFPELVVNTDELGDPRWTNCVNPMAVGIRLADKVHAVSPSYAEEITRSSSVESAFFGGEGLEADLLKAKSENRLIGILNGCNYPPQHGRNSDWDKLWKLVDQESVSLHGQTAATLARPETVLTSIGRATAQKLQIMIEQHPSGRTVLDELLTRLGGDGVFVLLGSGDADYEEFLARTAEQHDNFIYLNGYSDRVAEMIYQEGDLFLMPSSYEPCGISQMLAMRAGQPCLVHGVGGLNDTVVHKMNGFVYYGTSLPEQARDFLYTLDQALTTKVDSREKWQTIRHEAAAARFLWSDSVQKYETELYGCSK